jgi:hypothetical protein
MEHNRLTPYTNIDPEDDAGEFTTKPSDWASDVAASLVLTYAEALKDRKVSAFELMQSLAEFFVSTVKIIEKMDIPPQFRKMLMRNIELNFDYRDAKEQGLDLSELLIMGMREEMERGSGDS